MSVLAKHKPATLWATYMDRYPRVYIETLDRKHIGISFHDGSERGYGFVLTRTHARLLARRINQCLEDTK